MIWTQRVTVAAADREHKYNIDTSKFLSASTVRCPFVGLYVGVSYHTNIIILHFTVLLYSLHILIAFILILRKYFLSFDHLLVVSYNVLWRSSNLSRYFIFLYSRPRGIRRFARKRTPHCIPNEKEDVVPIRTLIL